MKFLASLLVSAVYGIITTKDSVKMRCSTDPTTETIVAWSGSVYSYKDQVKQEELWKLTGMNIARCFQDENGSWYMTSRELMYYVDLSSGQPATKWTNPWTKETVPVMHVANNPVTGPFGMGEDPMDSGMMNSNMISVPADINLFYPNPLSDAKYAPYAP